MPFLRWVLAFETTFIALILALIIGQAAFRRIFEARTHQQLTEARSRVAAQLDSNAEVAGTPAAEAFRSLPRRLQIRILWELAPHLIGRSLDTLQRLAVDADLDDWAEECCESPKWWRRLQGIRLLALLEIDRRAARPLINDPHPLVRAAAIEWAADFAAGPTLRRLVWQMDDDSALCRFTLQDVLLRMGRPIVPILANYLEDRGEEANPLAMDVATALAEPRFAPAAERLSRSSRPVLRARAATLLGSIGGEESSLRVGELLADPDPAVRASAAHAIGVMGHWQAASSVGRLLADRDWRVRRESGLALRALGGPGTLILRRHAQDDDRFARDMARHILEGAARTTA